MAITTGTIMLYGGIVGMALCLLGTVVLQKIFKRQRKRLLEDIRQEE